MNRLILEQQKLMVKVIEWAQRRKLRIEDLTSSNLVRAIRYKPVK